MLRTRGAHLTRAAATWAVAAPVSRMHSCCRLSAATSSSASTSRNAAAAAAVVADKAPRRKTYMQEQMELEAQQQEKQQQDGTVAAASDGATAIADTVEASSPPQLLSQMLLRAPQQSTSMLRPVQGMTAMQRLQHAGLVAKVTSGSGSGSQPRTAAVARTVLLPSGVRVLDKIERVLLDELAPLQAQEIQLAPADLPLEPQPSRRFQSSAARGAHAAAATALPSDAPYPTDLSRELPVLTELLSSEFGSAARGAYRLPLHKASLRTRVAHPAASAALSGASSSAAAATSLWSAAKHTSDFMSMHSSRRAGLECYQQTMDSFVRALSHIGLRQAMLLEASPHRVNASHGVDADLAHEVHVPVLSAAAQVAAANSAVGLAGSVLRCDQCSYAARRERAVSKLPSPSDVAAPPPTSSSTILSDPLQRHLRSLVAQQLALHYPTHVVQQLNLSVDATHWRCELVIDRSGVGTENEVATVTNEDHPENHAPPQLPLVYMVLLRSVDELSLTALSEHVGSLVPLERVEGTAATLHVLASLLSEHPTQLDELRTSLPSSQQALLARVLSSSPTSSPTPLLRVDSRPELLIDQALLPLANIDLDLEAMLHTETQQQTQQQQELLGHDPHEYEEDAQHNPEAEDEQPEDVSESESPLDAAAVAALHARMERSLLSSARSLGPGQSLDLVAVELAAQGKDVRAEQARLYAEGVEAQRQQHEAIEQEREQRRQQQEEAVRRTAKALQEEEETGEATSLELEPDSAANDAAGALSGVTESDPSLSSTTSSSFSSSSSFGLSSSRQGSFRLAQPGEQCAMCNNNGSNHRDHSSSAPGLDGKAKDNAAGGGGVLRAVRTAVLANGVFIGRQELVQAATTGCSTKTKKPKREFVHTSYARFSPLDTLALLAQQHLVSPSLLSAAQARGSSGADAAAVSLDTLTRLQWPALVAPFQCALLPVLSADAAPVAAGNLRDLHRARAARAATDPTEAAKTDERTWAAARQLHAQLMAQSSAAPTTASSPDAAIAAMTADLSSSLSSDVLLDDRTELPINARVQSLVASGVPILLLLQPRALAAGQVSLVLNRPGVSLAPRRVALEGLPKLLLQMLRAPHNPVIHARRKQRELDAQRKREEQEREQRAQQEEEELMQLQAEADEFQQ